MDTKALYSLSYGVFMLATKSETKVNGCIINTGIQVASDPARIAIACINSNLTCDMIKSSGVFTLSALDNTCTFETIKHFGMQSGRNVDKFSGIDAPVNGEMIPYLAWQTCAVFYCHVVDRNDLGSHTLFIAVIDDAFRLSENAPLTYADYQLKLKPKANPVKEKKIIGWRCKICNYFYEGRELPADYICPICGHDASDFEPVYEQ